MKSTLVLVLSLCAVAVPAAAQEIVLYQNQNFNGPQFAANESVTDLSRIGFNDRASSVKVRRGSWQLCSESFYRGSCVTLQPGDYPSLGSMGLKMRCRRCEKSAGAVEAEAAGAAVVPSAARSSSTSLPA